VNALAGVDFLFNNAGVEGAIAPLTKYPDRFHQVMAVNVKCLAGHEARRSSHQAWPRFACQYLVRRRASGRASCHCLCRFEHAVLGMGGVWSPV